MIRPTWTMVFQQYHKFLQQPAARRWKHLFFPHWNPKSPANFATPLVIQPTLQLQPPVLLAQAWDMHHKECRDPGDGCDLFIALSFCFGSFKPIRVAPCITPYSELLTCFFGQLRWLSSSKHQAKQHWKGITCIQNLLCRWGSCLGPSEVGWWQLGIPSWCHPLSRSPDFQGIRGWGSNFLRYGIQLLWLIFIGCGPLQGCQWPPRLLHF